MCSFSSRNIYPSIHCLRNISQVFSFFDKYLPSIPFPSTCSPLTFSFSSFSSKLCPSPTQLPFSWVAPNWRPSRWLSPSLSENPQIFWLKPKLPQKLHFISDKIEGNIFSAKKSIHRAVLANFQRRNTKMYKILSLNGIWRVFFLRNPSARRQILGRRNVQWAEGCRKVGCNIFCKESNCPFIYLQNNSNSFQSQLEDFWQNSKKPKDALPNSFIPILILATNLILILIVMMSRCAECVAIGECGLDFNRNFSPPEVQIEVFEKQVIINPLSWLFSR